MKFAALILILLTSQTLNAEPIPQPPMPLPIPGPIAPMYPRELYTLADESYEFSLPELTGCSDDFQLSRDERKNWIKITKDATIFLNPSKSQAGGKFAITLTCEREVLVTQTKTQGKPGGIQQLVTETIPVPEKRTATLVVHVSKSGPFNE